MQLQGKTYVTIRRTVRTGLLIARPNRPDRVGDS